MKKSEIFRLHGQLTRTDFNNICNSTVQYAIQKNINKLESEVQTIQKAIDASRGARFKELEQEIQPIYLRAIEGKTEREYAAIERGVLKKWPHASEYEEEKKRFEATVNELLDTESDYEPYTVKFSTLEPLNLNQMQMRAIMPLIVE